MNELEIIEYKIELPEGQKLSVSTGSVFHGALMESIDKKYAEYLHTMSLRPYSQCIYYNKNETAWMWRLCVLSKEAGEQLLFSLAQRDNIYIRHKNIEIKLIERRNILSTSYENLVDKYFAKTTKEMYVDFRFITSCSFKSQGNYMIFPQPHHVIGSLINKWNLCNDKFRLDGSNVLHDLSDEVFVADYNLKLQPFYLEGARIPAFRGSYVLGLKGNVMADRIICMLGEFAQYSGVGIKTALGMGAVACGFGRR